MKELSIFIDESGDFGEYDYHSPWYIVTMVFHEQEASIQEPMEYLNRDILFNSTCPLSLYTYRPYYSKRGRIL